MDIDAPKDGPGNRLNIIGRPNTVTALVSLTAFLLFGLNNTEMAALPAYTMTLGAGPFVASLQNSLFVLLAVLLRIPLEHVVEQRGSRFAIIAGALGYTAPCLLLAGCTELWQIIALRLAQAFGLALFQPSVAHYLTEASPVATLGKRLGIVRFATTASLMVGPVTVFPLITSYGYHEFFGALALAGACGTIIALMLPHAQANVATTQKYVTIDKPPSFRTQALLLISPLLLALGYSVVMNFGQTLAAEMFTGYNDGLLFACVSTGGLIGSLITGWTTDAFGVKRSVACSIASNGLGLLCMALGRSTEVVLTGAFLCGLGYFGAIATLIAAVGMLSKGSTGTLLARQQSALDVGMIAGGLVAGIMMQSGLSVSAVFLTTAAIASTSLVAWGMIYPTQQK